jgi:hypothetical protein
MLPASHFRELVDAIATPKVAIGAVILACGIVSACGGLKRILLARAASSWQSTRGRVVGIRHGVVDAPVTGELLSLSTVRLDYAYEVNGREYRGSASESESILPLDHCLSDQGTELQYCEGESVEVWFDPRRPLRSLLHREVTGRTYLQLTVGTSLALLGSCILAA